MAGFLRCVAGWLAGGLYKEGRKEGKEERCSVVWYSVVLCVGELWCVWEGAVMISFHFCSLCLVCSGDNGDVLIGCAKYGVTCQCVEFVSPSVSQSVLSPLISIGSC